MTFVQDVPVGAIVVFECGCRGHRMPAKPDARTIIVIVQWPCRDHGGGSERQMREIDALTPVSPFTNPQR